MAYIILLFDRHVSVIVLLGKHHNKLPYFPFPVGPVARRDLMPAHCQSCTRLLLRDFSYFLKKSTCLFSGSIIIWTYYSISCSISCFVVWQRHTISIHFQTSIFQIYVRKFIKHFTIASRSNTRFLRFMVLTQFITGLK